MQQASTETSRAAVAIFRVVNGQLAAVTEYLDTAYASRVLFGSQE